MAHRFVKLELRLLDDPRWFSLPEEDQLIYVKILLIAGLQGGSVPSDLRILKSLLRTERDASELELSIDRIKKNFPKVKSNKHFHTIGGMVERLTREPTIERTRVSVDIDKDKDIDSNAPKDLLHYFCDGYYKKLNKRYLITWGKDNMIVKAILSVLTPEEVKSVIDLFFASNDPFIKQAGYTIGVFKSQINKLRTQPQKKEMPVL